MDPDLAGKVLRLILCEVIPKRIHSAAETAGKHLEIKKNEVFGTKFTKKHKKTGKFTE